MKKLLLVILLSFCTLSSFSQVSFVNAFPNITFSVPVFLTHPTDNTNRIFVVQQGGTIKVFQNDSTTSSSTTFLDLTDKVLFGGERGLLGLAFHPNYTANRYFFVYYTRVGDGALTISRFTTQSGNPNKADSLSELVFVTVLHPSFSNHNGGNLMFGQDGYLYTGMGDGGSGGDPNNNAQNVNVMLGKIHRLDVNNPQGGNNYGIPPSNPFAAGGGRPEIYCWGVRNPWRFSQDPVTGKIYLGDVGQDSWEEVDTLAVGQNYGWRCYEGNHTYNTSGCGPIGNYTFPIKEYQNGPPPPECSITGGYVYRGTRVPWLIGRYVYGDYCSRKVWKLLYSNGSVSDTSLIGTTAGGILSFGVDQNNEQYVCCANNIIYKFFNTLIGINGNSNQLPADFTLAQNYPNPFNPVTHFSYQIPNLGFVQLKVYDINGREVSTLVNENKQAGSYSVSWDAAGFSSGIYFYRLIHNGFSIERKLALVK